MTHEEALCKVKGYLTDIIPTENYSEVEEIIEALEQQPNRDKEPCDAAISRTYRLIDLANAIESDDSGYWTNKRISSALRNIEQLPFVTQKSGKWIPVSERLPNEEEYRKNNGMFNVTDGNRSYSEWFDPYDRRFGEPTMCGIRVDRCVIAWQPLPEPYKESNL